MVGYCFRVVFRSQTALLTRFSLRDHDHFHLSSFWQGIELRWREGEHKRQQYCSAFFFSLTCSMSYLAQRIVFHRNTENMSNSRSASHITYPGQNLREVGDHDIDSLTRPHLP